MPSAFLRSMKESPASACGHELGAQKRRAAGQGEQLRSEPAHEAADLALQGADLAVSSRQRRVCSRAMRLCVDGSSERRASSMRPTTAALTAAAVWLVICAAIPITVMHAPLVDGSRCR